MTPSQLLSAGIPRRRLTARRAAADYFLSVQQFRALIDQERMRSDRNGATFCILLLTPQVSNEPQGGLEELAGCLQSRLRATDVAGLWSPPAAGVFLPDTSPRGAWKLAGDLLRLWNQRTPLDCRVYVYRPFAGATEALGAAEAGQSDSPEARLPVDQLESLLIEPLPAWKRAVDIVGAVVGLLVLFPFLAALAALIKLTSPGPVFFRQQRDGLGGKPFALYKFRTMRANAHRLQGELRPQSEQDGPAFKIRNDPRVTPLGRLLRRTCLDELPQLVNVLRGEMSLVGPRPMDSNEARECCGWQRRRLCVTPGMTCIWQVDGGSRVTFDEWMRMDLRYVEQRTPWLDFKLLVRTFLAVITVRASH